MIFFRLKGVFSLQKWSWIFMKAPEAPFSMPWKSQILQMLQCDMPLSNFAPQKFMIGLGGDPICSWMLLVYTLNI